MSRNSTTSQGGAITQLVAIGALDAYLTSDPDVTFFRSGFTKCSPFSAESVVQEFNTQPRFGGLANCQINRTGDLLYHMYLVVDLPGITLCKGDTLDDRVAHRESCNPCTDGDARVADEAGRAWRSRNYSSCDGGCGSDEEGTVAVERGAGSDELSTCPWVHWSNAIGQLLVQECHISIGNQMITQLWGELMFCLEEISGRVGRRLLEMVGKRYTRQELIVDSQEKRTLYVPLPFWFTLASGASLPLASMQFHSVQLSVKFRNLDDLLVINAPDESSKQLSVINCDTKQRLGASDLIANVMSTYIYLEMDERDNFATQKFESLVVQYQHQEIDGKGSSFDQRINFNHPIIELIWFCRRKCHEQNGAFFNFAGLESRDPLQDIELKLNHQHRFPGLPASYYRLVQPYQAHSCIPDTFVYCYSFALHPEDTCTPSGSCNFSRVDNVHMRFLVQDGLEQEEVSIRIYASNWNILRFKSGMAGLAYAN